ncbi:MAG: hypothetical protein C4530_10550 [Desulfobacteraceae bacterium]|nr:MAG: hypothetical protein C4530_10550 [Desulfobacteraceae bacterium]
MSGNRREKPSKALPILGLCAIIVAVAIGIGVWLKGNSETSRPIESSAPEEVVARKVPQGVPEGSLPITGRPEGPASPDTSTETASQPAVVDYGSLKEDKGLQNLMEKRKESYGFEKGVDLIVKPDESVKVGDEVVSMKEILDKIGLKSGEVIEKDLTGSEEKTARRVREELVSELDRAEKRYHELDELIENSDSLADPKIKETYLREREELGKIISAYKNYTETDRRIEERKKLLRSLDNKLDDKLDNKTDKTSGSSQPGSPVSALAATSGTEPVPGVQPPIGTPKGAAGVSGQTPPSSNAVKPPAVHADPTLPTREEASADGRALPDRTGQRHVTITELKKEIEKEINNLRLRKGDIENELKILMKKGKRPEAYGIYVVQYRDNIWNIHFKFLKEYFDHRGKGLPAQSDEPDPRGRSSGVGKILKFSEKMVYIYNIRERELASDIHLIHPLSKIVVFNMGKVFELLEDVDDSDMDQIQFDGENIWLPAKG